MSSQQQDVPSEVSLDGSNFSPYDTSIIVGVVIITLIVMVVMSITMNIWIRYKNMKFMMMSSRDSVYSNNSDNSSNSNNTIVSISQATLKMLTKPSPAYNKETTLPVYRRSDSWETYVQMIQTPEKLNDVVHSMKVSQTPEKLNDVAHSAKLSHTPSSSISTKVDLIPSDDSIDNNSSYTSDDYKLYRETCLPKEYEDND